MIASACKVMSRLISPAALVINAKVLNAFFPVALGTFVLLILLFTCCFIHLLRTIYQKFSYFFSQ